MRYFFESDKIRNKKNIRKLVFIRYRFSVSIKIKLEFHVYFVYISYAFEIIQ